MNSKDQVAATVLSTRSTKAILQMQREAHSLEAKVQHAREDCSTLVEDLAALKACLTSARSLGEDELVLALALEIREVSNRESRLRARLAKLEGELNKQRERLARWLLIRRKLTHG